LTQGSIRLLSTLRTTLQINAYVPKGLPRAAPFISHLTALLTAYQRESKGKLEFRLIEPITAELREQARQDGIVEHLPADENDASGANQFLGLALEYSNEKAVIPQLPYDSANGLEFWITNKIREIRDKADGIKHRIGVVTGKDELKLSDAYLVPKQADGNGPTIKGVLTQAFPFYQIEDVELRRGTSAIDPGLVGLIITQPQKDYTAAELSRIDEFLMLGDKSLVVYASAVNLKASDPNMLATLSTHGLDTLLDGYGIHMNKDAVFDYGGALSLPLTTAQGQTVFLRHCGIALVNGVTAAPGTKPLLDGEFAGFFRMEEVALPFASSLELARDRQPADVTLRAVARSTPEASVESTATVNMSLREVWHPKPPQQQRILAAYAQGKLKSAFAGKPGANPNTPERARGSSRVLVVSSSLFLANPFAYAGNAPPGARGGDIKLLMVAQPYTKYLTATILSVKNTLDWMSNDEDLVSLSTKIIPREKSPQPSRGQLR
jgi:ABC-type uncharacterized transport system involved in gliding motility auxiliary subunit